jgi:hypothetical protein
VYSIPVLIHSNVEESQYPQGPEQILGWKECGFAEPFVEEGEPKFEICDGPPIDFDVALDDRPSRLFVLDDGG